MVQGNRVYVLSSKGLFKADPQPWNGDTADATRFVPDPVMGKVFKDQLKDLVSMVSDGKGGTLFSTSDEVHWAAPDKEGRLK